MQYRADGFHCKQCGRCCNWGFQIQVTEDDLWRWEMEGREDILDWVDPIEFPDHVEYDFPIYPLTGEEVGQCPFLIEVAEEGKFACRIYTTKPESCSIFPTDREHAERAGCPGYE